MDKGSIFKGDKKDQVSDSKIFWLYPAEGQKFPALEEGAHTDPGNLDTNRKALSYKFFYKREAVWICKADKRNLGLGAGHGMFLKKLESKLQGANHCGQSVHSAFVRSKT